MHEKEFETWYKPAFDFWYQQIMRVGRRLGFDPFPPDFRFCRPRELISLYPYVGLPVYPGTWNNGKHVLDQLFKFNLPEGHKDKARAAWELILNSNPVVTYMNLDARMPVNMHILPHANVGHSSFFKHNFKFKGTNPEHVLEEFAGYAQRLEQLANDPEFGIDRLEYTWDAAYVISSFNRETSETLVPEKELRERLESELRRLQGLRARPGTVVGFDVDELDKQIAAIAARLKRDPINRRRDIVSFILDEKNNPGLSDNEREVIKIAAAVSRYFRAQTGTKHMNEGYAELCARLILQDPQTRLPPNWYGEWLLFYRNMFDGNPVDWLTSPYALARFLYERKVKERCHLQGQSKAPAPVYRVVSDPRSDHARLAALKSGKTMADLEMEYDALSSAAWAMRDPEGNLLEIIGYEEEVVDDVDYEPIREIVKNYEDLTFFHSFLEFDAYEELFDNVMHWVEERFRQITHTLKMRGWSPTLFADPIPRSLDEKLEKVEQWMGTLQGTQQSEVPDFPAYQTELEWMGGLMMDIKSYFVDRKKWRERHIASLALTRQPDISVIDGGLESASTTGSGSNKGRTLVLEHLYDPMQLPAGQLLPDWAIKSIELAPRIWKQGGAKILTTVEVTDDDDNVTGTKPWHYTAEIDSSGKVQVTNGEVY